MRLAAGLLAVSLLACGGDARPFAGTEIDPPLPLDAPALPDVSRGGEPFEFTAPSDGLLVVFFGFTNCPDICPTTMADLALALEDLGDDADRVTVAMVTVDPERDTPVLTDYVQGFVPGAHALATDDQAALQAVAGPFGVSYHVHTTDDGEVEVGHSSNLFAVDDTGALVLTWSVGGTEGTARADDIAGDLRQLLDR